MKRLFSDFAGAFPKRKGMADMSSIKHTFKLIRGGHVVGIFVEGDRSWDGETEPIIEGVISIISKLKVAVRLANVTGGYLSYPRWAETKRRGKIIVEFRTISKKDVVSLSKDELSEKVTKIMYRNDLKDPRMEKVVFRGKRLAHGIENLLWLCPSCGIHDSLYGEGDIIICRGCGREWGIDGNQRINPGEAFGGDLKDWNDWQKSRIRELVAQKNKKPLTISKNVGLFEKIDGDEVSLGEGDLSLYEDRILFSPREKIEEIIFENPFVRDYIDNFNRNFQFNYKNKRFKIYFGNQNSCKWIFFLRHLHARSRIR